MNPNASSTRQHARFDLLDGARGVAALAVMVYHYTNRTELHWMMGAWVAVDLFFILSGFVIALSYGQKIRQGMGFARFAAVRLLRLAPLYMAGLLLGYAGMLLAASRPDSTVTMQQATQALVMGALWLPWFNDIGWPFDGATIVGAFYPLNDPAWSLAFELMANAFFFFWVVKAGTVSSPRLVTMMLAVFIVGSLALRQFNPGFGHMNWTLGFPRVLGEFLLGALIFQRRWHERRYPAMLVACVALLAVALMVPDKRSFAIANSWLVIPLVVPLLASTPVRGRALAACRALGELSYPLYVIHVPVARLVYELLPSPGLSTISRALLTGVVAVALAMLLGRLDAALRAGIGTMLQSRRPAKPGALDVA